MNLKGEKDKDRALLRKSSGQTTTYTYDYENRLKRVQYPGMDAQYKYDAFGRRIEKNVNGQITNYLHDGMNIVTDFTGGWYTLKSKYVHSLAIDDPLSVEQGANIYYYHKDGLGSVTELTDANGNVVKTYDYRGFGEIHAQSGTVVQPFAFTSREYDSESGLYFYRGRYYDPKAGRFINRDPIGFAGGDVNLFRYVQNNPVNFADPLGLFNPMKAASALGNAGIAGFSGAAGFSKIAIAVGLSPAAATGGGALPPAALLAWGTWNLNSAVKAWERSQQQWKEAQCEDWSQATWKNLYGLLPGGTNYDDPSEYSGPFDYVAPIRVWILARR